MRDLALAHTTLYRLRPDPSRVIARLFIPGQELTGGSEGRTLATVQRVLALRDDEVSVAVSDLFERFSHRHADLALTFERHATRVVDYVDGSPLDATRRQLLGAVFTHEYAIEGTSVCNPSLVVDPDQSGVAPEAVRVIMSLRAIGEGHISSIGFRRGLIDDRHVLTMEDAAPFPEVARTSTTEINRDVVHGRLRDLGTDGPTAAAVLDQLGRTFSPHALESAISRIATQQDTRLNVTESIFYIREAASLFYGTSFADDLDISRRVLWPATPAEERGMEDARFVWVADGATPHYRASYTAFNGHDVSQQLLRTSDFTHFTSQPLTGVGSQNKGLAFFPRRVGGRHLALSRHDRESNTLVSSRDSFHWENPIPLQVPQTPWDLVQLGNCGSPLETSEGWIMLTHGVGPMRTYSLSALLLDLEQPHLVRGHLSGPLRTVSGPEQDGYVPNVVYSCGGLIHRDILHVCFGIADQSIGHMTISVTELLAAFVRVP